MLELCRIHIGDGVSEVERERERCTAVKGIEERIMDVTYIRRKVRALILI